MLPTKRQSFIVKTELDAPAVWDRIIAHAEVREHADPAPSPAPPQGPRFLATRVGDEILLRVWAGPADAASPIVHLHVIEDPRGCIIRGNVEHPRQSRSLATPGVRLPWQAYVPPLVGLALALGIAWTILGGGIWILFVLILLAGVPAGLVIIPGLLWWEAESRKEQSTELWALLGQLFAPLALPLGRELHPFREKGTTR